jgi:sugar O-acyltransferase (sialic acid O-acetyltransferase NeuD family)
MSGAPVIVVGAGGHGIVVADALLAAGREVLGFVDRDPTRHGAPLLGRPVFGDDAALAAHDPRRVELANGIGGAGGSTAAGLRQRVQHALECAGWRFAGVCHPAAIVSPHAHVDAGAQVLAGAVVQPLASVEAGAIVNTRAVVEHHCRVGAYAHVATGAVLCGDVSVGAGAHVGAGAVVKNGVTLGAGVVVGAGAAVLRDVASGTVVGVPARPLEEAR